MTRVPEYRLRIDWLGHGGLAEGPGVWSAVSASTPPSVMESSDEQPFEGKRTLKVVGSGTTASSRVERFFKSSSTHTLSISSWVYLPSGSYLDVRFELFGPEEGAPSWWFDTHSGKDAWHLFTVDLGGLPKGDWRWEIYAAGSGSETYYIGPSWISSVENLEDASCDILATRVPPVVRYGRDASRNLDDVRPGDFRFALKNNTHKYTNSNPGSPLRGLVRPNRQVILTAEHDGLGYTLFNGFIDDIQIEAAKNEQAVYFSAIDQLARLQSEIVHTPIMESGTTGDAVHAVLDAIGHTGPRNIDRGSTILSWWAIGGMSALDALRTIIELEGPPAIFHVGEAGEITFRDRQHRYKNPRSVTPQGTLFGCRDEGTLWLRDSSSFSVGWSDVVNRVSFTGGVGKPSAEITQIYSTTDKIQIPASDSVVITETIEDGFFNARKLVEGKAVWTELAGLDSTQSVVGYEPEEHDYVVSQGEVSTELIRTSGTLLEVRITSLHGKPATVDGLRVRGQLLGKPTDTGTVEDTTSQSFYAATREHTVNANGATQPDVLAIARKVLADRAYSKPVFELNVFNHDTNHIDFQLGTDIGDRLHVEVDEWFTDADVFVESIHHKGDKLGTDHTTTLYAEQATHATAATPFKFDTPGHGFNQGAFGYENTSKMDVFVVGQSQLDSTKKLAY